MIPIRCLSCGKPVSAVFDEYNKRVAAGEKSKDVLERPVFFEVCKIYQILCKYFLIFLIFHLWLEKVVKFNLIISYSLIMKYVLYKKEMMII